MNALARIPEDQARLPQAYEAAKLALANCASIDECKDWADKAHALASYSKQANDDTLQKQAQRIQARAIKRCGQLLKQFDGRKGQNLPSTKSGPEPTFSKTQSQAAEEAGLSKDQQVQAVRVANVPDEDFEAQVDSDNPPTVKALAKQGTKAKPKPVIDLKGRNPKDFNAALHFKAKIADYFKEIAAYDLSDILPRLIDTERAAIRESISKIDAIHDAIITRI